MDDYGEVPGARNVETVLQSDPIGKLLGPLTGDATVIGFVLFFLIVAMVVFGPSSGSRFIYTDF